jgi:hypothetical protein
MQIVILNGTRPAQAHRRFRQGLQQDLRMARRLLREFVDRGDLGPKMGRPEGPLGEFSQFSTNEFSPHRHRRKSLNCEIAACRNGICFLFGTCQEPFSSSVM